MRFYMFGKTFSILCNIGEVESDKTVCSGIDVDALLILQPINLSGLIHIIHAWEIGIHRSNILLRKPQGLQGCLLYTSHLGVDDAALALFHIGPPAHRQLGILAHNRFLHSVPLSRPAEKGGECKSFLSRVTARRPSPGGRRPSWQRPGPCQPSSGEAGRPNPHRRGPASGRPK